MDRPAHYLYPPSPCINVCTLDEAGFCVGCRRSLDEITRWTSMSPDEQRAVIATLPRREGAR